MTWGIPPGDFGLNVVKWNGTAWQVIANNLPNNTYSFTDENVAPGGTYYYDVVAMNLFGETWAAAFATISVV